MQNIISWAWGAGNVCRCVLPVTLTSVPPVTLTSLTIILSSLGFLATLEQVSPPMENNGQEIDEGGDATKGPQEGIGTEEEGRFEGEMADDETVRTEGEAIYEGKMESSGEAPQETEMEPIGESAPDMEVESIGEAPQETEVEFIGEAAPQTEVEFVGEAAPETEVESVGEAAPEMEVESVGEAPLEQDIESIGKTIAEMDLDSIGEAILGVNLDSLEGVIPERKVEFTGEVIPQGDVESTGYTIPEGELEVSGREGLEEYTFSEMDEFSERISTPEFTYSDISPWEMTEEEANAAYLYERPRSTEASQRAFGTYETTEQRKESKVSAPRVFAKAPHCSRGSSPCERSLKARYHHILGFLLL